MVLTRNSWYNLKLLDKKSNKAIFTTLEKIGVKEFIKLRGGTRLRMNSDAVLNTIVQLS